jgi:hypothetical protein
MLKLMTLMVRPLDVYCIDDHTIPRCHVLEGFFN